MPHSRLQGALKYTFDDSLHAAAGSLCNVCGAHTSATSSPVTPAPTGLLMTINSGLRRSRELTD